MENRYLRVMKQIVGNKEQSLKALTQEFQRQSVSRKIAMVEKEFENLEDEFKRVMHYKLSQYEMKVSPLPQQLKENMEYALQVKAGSLASLEQKMKLYDPKLKQKEGWAEVILNGKRVDLSKIKKDSNFVLMDTKVKLEVKCMVKEKI